MVMKSDKQNVAISADQLASVLQQFAANQRAEMLAMLDAKLGTSATPKTRVEALSAKAKADDKIAKAAAKPSFSIRLEDKARDGGQGILLAFGGMMDRWIYAHELVTLIERLDDVKAFLKKNVK